MAAHAGLNHRFDGGFYNSSPRIGQLRGALRKQKSRRAQAGHSIITKASIER
jgi:hypothetical protein